MSRAPTRQRAGMDHAGEPDLGEPPDSPRAIDRQQCPADWHKSSERSNPRSLSLVSSRPPPTQEGSPDLAA
jgi:hypothetical protein